MTAQEKKSKAKRNHRKLIGCAFLFTAAIVLVVLSLTIWFSAEQCSIEGKTRYTKRDFWSAMQLDKQSQNIFTSNKKELAQKIKKQLPYIDSVKIYAEPPGTLRLIVSERQAAFAQYDSVIFRHLQPVKELLSQLGYTTLQDSVIWWQFAALSPLLDVLSAENPKPHWWLMDADGVLLERAAVCPDGLIAVRGAFLDHPQAGAQAKWYGAQGGALALLYTLVRNSSFSADITGVTLQKAGLPYFIYQNRIALDFGNAVTAQTADMEQNLYGKLKIAETILQKLDAQDDLQHGILDLSTAGKGYFRSDWSIR
ncbi:MAG: FtsQ-type POTRA domain-containing protein [Oscillospiraceae bacterium]|jgi:hypothetical protein|nr:FtsQ-type POTRA domain-containing protein [Oscillospiraceae bacterium]